MTVVQKRSCQRAGLESEIIHVALHACLDAICILDDLHLSTIHDKLQLSAALPNVAALRHILAGIRTSDFASSAFVSVFVLPMPLRAIRPRQQP